MSRGRIKINAALDKALVHEVRERIDTLGLAAVTLRSVVEDALREHALPRLDALLENKKHTDGACLLKKIERAIKINSTIITNKEAA